MGKGKKKKKEQKGKKGVRSENSAT